MKKQTNGKWVQKVVGSPSFKKGAFTAQAKRAGMSVGAYAKHVLKPGSKATETTKRRARLAQTLKGMHKKKK